MASGTTAVQWRRSRQELVPAKFEMTANIQAYHKHDHGSNDHHMYGIIYISMDQIKKYMLVIVASGGG